MQSIANDPNPIERKLAQIFDPHHDLTKNDLIWILESIKKKVADEDPSFLALSQPRLLKNFYYFAEISMMLIHQKNFCVHEVDRLKTWVSEAYFGLYPH